MVSDEQNSYTYDSLGELVQTNGAVNAAYTYDSRGNMLSRTVNGEKTVFAYSNTQWQDQLTSVNGKVLTYDANGNLQSYDGAEYTWSHGKQLSSITNGDSTFKYQYDLNGIRSYKTVNGVTISNSRSKSAPLSWLLLRFRNRNVLSPIKILQS